METPFQRIPMNSSRFVDQAQKVCGEYAKAVHGDSVNLDLVSVQ